MTPQGEVIVRTSVKALEVDRNDLLAIQYGQCVNKRKQQCYSTLQNQDPVLNEAAQRLGVSLRQTEDQLMRDMLAATATFINCVGGTNGGIAVLKSDLIDSKLSACNDGDNEAQAIERLAA